MLTPKIYILTKYTIYLSYFITYQTDSQTGSFNQYHASPLYKPHPNIQELKGVFKWKLAVTEVMLLVKFKILRSWYFGSWHSWSWHFGSWHYFWKVDILRVDILRVDILGSWRFGSWYNYFGNWHSGSWHFETNSIETVPFQAYRVMLRLLEPGTLRGGRVGGYFPGGPQTFKGPHEAFILLLWLHLQALSLSSLSIALSGLSESTLE